MKEQSELKYLLEKYTNNTCTREEFNRLLELVEQDHNVVPSNELLAYWQKAGVGTTPAADHKVRFSTLMNEARLQASETGPKPKKSRSHLIRWTAAAAVLVFIAGGYFAFYQHENLHTQNKPIPGIVANNYPEVAPGSNKAVLILADGSAINLDSVKNGTIAKQGNVKIIKGEDGELLYYVDRQRDLITGTNTISTPRGGKYTVVLSDGTKVWLNAASSLTFPASFVDNMRNVSLTGEGYFEVAKDAGKPFQVKTNNLTVEVLGTHFNINAYPDESSVATTLLEGSVKITLPPLLNQRVPPALLKPGEQAKFTSERRLKIDPLANTQAVIAWKNNNFEFENTPIPVIMRQISRWYDVEVEYKGSIPVRRLTGKFSRTVSLNQLIGMLEYTGLHMKMQNQKIIVW